MQGLVLAVGAVPPAVCSSSSIFSEPIASKTSLDTAANFSGSDEARSAYAFICDAVGFFPASIEAFQPDTAAAADCFCW
jgi:hypothetical protein